MAKLLDVQRDDDPVELSSNQMLLYVDDELTVSVSALHYPSGNKNEKTEILVFTVDRENVNCFNESIADCPNPKQRSATSSPTMVLDIKGLRVISDGPLTRGKEWEEFKKKYVLLTKEELQASFKVPWKSMLAILVQAEPCIGCRRSVEKRFSDLSKSGQSALDPLVISTDGVVSIKEEVLKSPQLLCTILHGHSARLNNLVENQPRNRKSRRCVLHSLEIQRMRPPPNAWKEVWDCMALPCQQELALIETDTLDDTLDTYLRKHRFCGECRNKVLLASSLLTREPEPTKEKGYVPVLYSGIKRCINEHHVHLPAITEYIGTLIGRAQPEVMGRERHAKTLEVAQEEVLTCLGICVAEKLHRVYRRLKEEETVCKVLAAVAIDALSRNFQMAVEVKQGISQLELLYKELTREEIVKQQRREKLRLKRKKKKERRYETEEKENSCDCSSEKKSKSLCICTESKPTKQNINRHKLQVLDPKNKGPPTCKCSDCLKKPKTCSISQSQSKAELTFPVKKTTSVQKATVKNSAVEAKVTFSISQSKQSSISPKQLPQEDSSDTCDSCKEGKKISDSEWHYENNCKDSVRQKLDWITKSKYADLWFLTRMGIKKHFSSEQSSQDYGYSSEHNISSSSLPSTPEGSEVACNECCDHEGSCHVKLNHSSSSIYLLMEGSGYPTLTQMLKDSYSSNYDDDDGDDDDDKKSYIPIEEVLEFKSRMREEFVKKRRQELRQTLKERFAMLCNHQKRLFILQ
ncbi:gametogenetin-binding protein 2-like isoform X2 [Linepithema humile]|uniref:gametogenetin-binding protein 2-like isoform X2 n=1 Tax=Linepithema humile TaxID=83485 RepID=UPI00351EA0FD